MVAKPKGLVRGKIVHSREATKFDKVVMKTANTEKIIDILNEVVRCIPTLKNNFCRE